MNLGSIKINNQTSVSVIDIEGIIGIPEGWQFDKPQDKVSTYNKFKDTVNTIKELDSTSVIVNIRSQGGNVNDALLIHDTLKALDANVTTVCYGYIASAATIIAQAASVSCRHISENALYLIHKASTCIDGNAQEIEQQIGMLKKTDDLIANIYSTRSGKPLDTFETLMTENNGNGKWLTASEVIGYSLADEIILPQTQYANTITDQVLMLKLPAIPKNITNNKPQPITMKVKETWVAIMAYFGFDNKVENTLTEAQVEKLNAEMERQTLQISNLQTENQTLSTQIINLTQSKTIVDKKLGELQTENDQLKAKPTQTEPKQDPRVQVPGAEVKMSSNQVAYNADVESFKN